VNTKTFLKALREVLFPQYGASESAVMERMVADFLIRKAFAPANPDEERTPNTQTTAQQILAQLRSGRPIQYVLEEAWFDERAFYVNESVLIPRPETEELFHWIKTEQDEFPILNQILEIGTGSGILAISLKRVFPQAVVTAIDVDEKALIVAKRNAEHFGESVHFQKMNFTDPQAWNQLPKVDLLVSNPPYIPLSEKDSLSDHVRLYEPPLALFTPAEDPLLFYRLIATFGRENLLAKGRIYVEMHEDRSQQTQILFEEMGYQTIVRLDMQGKKRMLRATILS